MDVDIHMYDEYTEGRVFFLLKMINMGMCVYSSYVIMTEKFVRVTHVDNITLKYLGYVVLK